MLGNGGLREVVTLATSALPKALLRELLETTTHGFSPYPRSRKQICPRKNVIVNL